MKTQLATLVGWAMAALVPFSGAAQIVFSPVVDVMVVYEGNAFAASPDKAAEANEIIGSANDALELSGLGERYDLAYLHTQPLPFSIAPGTTATQVKAIVDLPANASAITSLRNTYGADLVVLVTEHLYDPALGGDHCGAAYSVEAMPDPQYRDIAYRMVVQRPCILSANANARTAAAHELGHLLYLEHQLVAGPNPDTNPANPVRYNHPHFSGDISTLMVAGPTVCGAGCAIANLHSDPQATYPGTTLVRGHSYDRDDKRMIFETFPVVAQYRPPPAPSAPPERPICFIEFVRCNAGRKEWIVSWEHNGQPQPFAVFDVDYTYNPSGGWSNFFDGDAICAPTTPSTNSTIIFRARVSTSYGLSPYCQVSILGANCTGEHGD